MAKNIPVCDGYNHVEIPYSGSKIRFWHSNQTFNKASTCPWAQRAEIALVEKQIPFELKIADLSNKSDEFKSAYRSQSPDPNARAKVPILDILDEDGNIVTRLLESGPIAKFIATSWRERAHDLLPSTPLDSAQAEIFVETFMSQVTPSIISLMRSQHEDDCLVEFERLCIGLSATGNWIRKCGPASNQGPFFLGQQYSLAECLTAPFVVRILAQLQHNRGVDILSACDQLGYPELRVWMEATRDRSSTVATSPAVASLIQVSISMAATFPFTLYIYRYRLI